MLISRHLDERRSLRHFSFLRQVARQRRITCVLSDPLPYFPRFLSHISSLLAFFLTDPPSVSVFQSDVTQILPPSQPHLPAVLSHEFRVHSYLSAIPADI